MPSTNHTPPRARKELALLRVHESAETHPRKPLILRLEEYSLKSAYIPEFSIFKCKYTDDSLENTIKVYRLKFLQSHFLRRKRQNSLQKMIAVSTGG